MIEFFDMLLDVRVTALDGCFLFTVNVFAIQPTMKPTIDPTNRVAVMDVPTMKAGIWASFTVGKK